MAYKVIYTDKLLASIDNLYSLVSMVYSQRTLDSLVDKIENVAITLSFSPLIGQVEPGTEFLSLQYRRCVLKPYFKLIYIIDGDIVYLVDVWDARQDPKVLISSLGI